MRILYVFFSVQNPVYHLAPKFSSHYTNLRINKYLVIHSSKVNFSEKKVGAMSRKNIMDSILVIFL